MKEDFRVERERKQRLQPYDSYLKSFKYKAALDEVLKTKNHLVIISMYSELSRREGLRIALSGRNEDGLAPILDSITASIGNPKYTNIATIVADIVLGTRRML